MKIKQDVRTDLFQIGVTVYELVTGKNPSHMLSLRYLAFEIDFWLTIMPPVLTLDGDSNGLFSQFINMLMYLKAIHSTLEME